MNDRTLTKNPKENHKFSDIWKPCFGFRVRFQFRLSFDETEKSTNLLKSILDTRIYIYREKEGTARLEPPSSLECGTSGLGIQRPNQ